MTVRTRRLNTQLMAVCASGLTAALLGACGDDPIAVRLDTPERTLDSAQLLVESGRADRLVDLVHAESPEMRSLLNQFGRTLGEMQRLAAAIEQRFPEEIEELRAEAAAAAAEGRAVGLLDRLAGGSGPARRGGFGADLIRDDSLRLDTGASRRSRPPSPFGGGRASESQREAFNTIAQQVFADPFKWLADGRERLDTVYVSDEMVALTWDGKALLPPFGIALIDDEGSWRLLLPTRYPGVSRVMPRTPDEYAVWGAMAKTLENVVIDLRRDVEGGRVRNLTDLADSAVEKIAIPAVLIMYAMSEVMEERKRPATPKAEESPGLGTGGKGRRGPGSRTESRG
jgi:hypothetical protein